MRRYISLAIGLASVVAINFSIIKPVDVEAVELDRAQLYKIDEDITDIKLSLSSLYFNKNRSEKISRSKQNVIKLFPASRINKDMSPLLLTNYSAKEFNIILSGTCLEGEGEIFENVEKLHKINGLFLIGLSAQEQGLGKDRLAKSKNNYTSYGAWDSNIDNASVFKSAEHCFMATAKLLKRDYLSTGGKYYNGLTIKDVNQKYASDKAWAGNILSIMKKLNTKLENTLEQREEK